MASLDKYTISLDHHTRSVSDGLVFVLSAFDVQVTGVPITGGTVRCDIFSIEENKFWDATNNTWAAAPGLLAHHTAPELNSTLSSTVLPGIYTYGGLLPYNTFAGCSNSEVGISSRKGYIVKWSDEGVSPAQVIGYQFINITDSMEIKSNLIKIHSNTSAGQNAMDYFHTNGYGIQPAGGAVNTWADIRVVNQDTTAALNMEKFFDDTGFNASNSTIGTASVASVVSSVGNGAISSGSFATDAIDGYAIAANAIGASELAQNAITHVQIAQNAIGVAELAGNAITSVQIANNAIGAAELAANSITSVQIARNAIGAAELAGNCITNVQMAKNAIGSLELASAAINHLELGESAAEEIQNAVWNASVWKPIENLNNADTSGADVSSMGYAMLLQYITKNLLHWDGSAMTSVHTCSTIDSAGTKFYATTVPATADKLTPYIDKSAVLVKSWTPGGAATSSIEMYPVRIKGGTVNSHFEIHQMDEDQSAIPGGIDTTDVLIVKGETDSTMHEIAHEVWEESVFDHATEDTFGMFNRIIAGLSQYNHRIKDPLYDQTGRLTACRLVVYPSASDAENGTNPLATIIVKSTYDDKQNMSTYLSKRES